MHIARDNLLAKVTDCSDKELAWLDAYLGLPDPTGFWRGDPGARINLLSLHRMAFPSGLVPLVQTAARREGYGVQVVDERTRPCDPDPSRYPAWLRGYQEDAVDEAAYVGRGIIKASTGAGKGEVIAGLSALLPCTWLVLTHRASVFDELHDRLTLRLPGETIGRIRGAVWAPQRVTVATVQTLAALLQRKDERARRLLAGTLGFHFDEVHVAPAEQARKVLTKMPAAYFRFGYSGTPLDRGDRKGLLAIAETGPVIYEIAAEKLVELGAVARPRVHLVRVVSETRSSDPLMSYADAYRRCVVEDRGRMAALVRTAKQAPSPSFCFVQDLEHGAAVARALVAAGLRATFVQGKDGLDARRRVLRAMRQGDLDVVVCTTVFQEGVDVPEAQSVILAGGGKSTIRVLQNIGRGMRRTARDGTVTKDVVPVYDLSDTHCGCRRTQGSETIYGHRTCRWLDQHSRARRSAYMKAGYEVVEV